ncbi:hypothetical protein MSIMFI_04766 [Mycobacterium simulans]|uniref:hypothetical protein n=1 Tax=Mycobacterium simulans TaxID=627089 RepID=UPI0019B7F983|nr:hypothetical protein [Mycobacterium simulans]SON63236.1 hypothetical protein MSIMFI_04766 [Mycobacterium simulans]
MNIAVAAGLVVATAILRSQAITAWGLLNPDEAELMVQARAALVSPVPFSTWITGTTGPYWVLFLAGLSMLGAPLTLAFAHLLAAVLWALAAAALFVAASRVIGRGPAIVVTLVWWFPVATTFLVGDPVDFGALSTEYLPTLLIVASALVPREQLAARPWLFGVLGVLAGLAVGAKYQLAPVALAFAAAQLIVLRPSARHVVVSLLWWIAGAVLPVAAIVLVMVASPATNWALVEQTFTFIASYGSGRSQLQRVTSTFTALIRPWAYQLVTLAGLIWLSRFSDRRSNLARVVLVAGGLTAVLIGGMGYPHYLIAFFGAVGLAATMPVKMPVKMRLKPDARLRPQWLLPTALALVMGLAAAVVLMVGYTRARWAPLPPQAVVAAFSSNSVNRDPTLARACPPGLPAVVWGWAAELYIAQDWQSAMPYLNAAALSWSPANREAGEPIVRAGIDRAACILDATGMIRPNCPVDRPDQLVTFCSSAKFSLPRAYPQLAELIGRQFHTVPITGRCDGCTLYVRNSS